MPEYGVQSRGWEKLAIKQYFCGKAFTIGICRTED